MQKKKKLQKKKKTNVKKINKKKNKINEIIDFVILVFIGICLGVLVYSGYQLYLWHNDNKNIAEQEKKIEDSVDVVEQEDTDATELVNPPKDKNSPYWYYMNLKLIDVDFSALKKINSEVVGWIQVAGTNVNYPFVQTKNNSYYLTHQFDKKYNVAGWIFMDYRNNKEDFDKNTIIYGHGRLNQTMFGTLRNIIKSSWYKNKDNYVVKLSTEYENTLWQVFSTYHIKTTNDYLQIDFSNDNEYLNFLNMLKNRSIYNYNVELTASDKIVTLSTCLNDKEKVVLHAKLIKRESK